MAQTAILDTSEYILPESIHILLATYNGERFLKEQLASLVMQTHGHIDITVSDDGSTDSTCSIIENSLENWKKGDVTLGQGPRMGFADNFRNLVTECNISQEYFAFCDQDDIWDNDKLDHAVSILSTNDRDVPSLYCGRTKLIDGNGQLLGYSPLMRRVPSFSNALVQSIAGGNTMVMNRTAFDIVRKASQNVEFVSHDWWTYLLVSGAGGYIYYDIDPKVSYRQHGSNMVGSNIGANARLRRMKRLLNGDFFDWTEINLAGLNANKHLLTNENAAFLDTFSNARSRGGLKYATTVFRAGVRRQTLLGNLSLFVGATLGRV